MSAHRQMRALTSARGIAAWWVVLYHLRGALEGVPPAMEAVLAKGYVAVDFFFLLSGFVLALSHGERLRAGGMRAVPAFLRRRIARIWPLHAVMLGVALLLVAVLRATGRTTQDFPLAELPAHLLLVQAWGFANPLCWNDPAWSISCELAAYLLFPFWAMAMDWRRQPVLLLLAVVGALLALLHGAFALRAAADLGQDITHLGVLRCLLEFATGTVLFAVWERGRRRHWRPAILMAFLLGAGWVLGLPETAAIPGVLAMLLLALAFAGDGPGTWLDGAVLHRLGEISYATYLSHFLLWFAFKLAFVHGETIGWPRALLYLVLVLAASEALHRLVERPAQAWINRLPIRRSRTPLPAPRSPRG